MHELIEKALMELSFTSQQLNRISVLAKEELSKGLKDKKVLLDSKLEENKRKRAAFLEQPDEIMSKLEGCTTYGSTTFFIYFNLDLLESQYSRPIHRPDIAYNELSF
jgi:hypothetical protein